MIAYLKRISLYLQRFRETSCVITCWLCCRKSWLFRRICIIKYFSNKRVITRQLHLFTKRINQNYWDWISIIDDKLVLIGLLEWIYCNLFQPFIFTRQSQDVHRMMYCILHARLHVFKSLIPLLSHSLS